MKAPTKNYHQSPRKVRLVADAVRGKTVASALVELRFMPKRAAKAVSKLISSAAANAEQSGQNPTELKVATITVDDGVTMKRFRPRARGSASPIRKRTSNIKVELGASETKAATK